MMSTVAKFTGITMIKLRKLLARKIRLKPQTSKSYAIASEIWNSRFHLWTVSRTRYRSETYKALKFGPDRSLKILHTRTPGEGDSPPVSTSDIRESWKLGHSMKGQRLMVLFVRATWREHVIAVKRHRQAIFGLWIHIVPERRTLVSLSSSFCVVRLICMRTILFMGKKDTRRRTWRGTLGSYCPHSIYFRSSLCYVSLRVPLDRLMHVHSLLILTSFVLESSVQCTSVLYCH